VRFRVADGACPLFRALEGVISDTQRWLLGEQLDHIAALDEKIVRLDGKIEELMRPFVMLIEKLCEIPGVGRRVAEVILAEIGTNMKQYSDYRLPLTLRFGIRILRSGGGLLRNPRQTTTCPRTHPTALQPRLPNCHRLERRLISMFS